MAEYVRIFRYAPHPNGTEEYVLYADAPGDCNLNPGSYTKTSYKTVHNAAKAARKRGGLPWAYGFPADSVTYY